MLQQCGGLTLFRFASFPELGIVHAISTRHGGVSPPPYDTLNLSLSVPDDPDRVMENRRRFAVALRADLARLVTSRQVHGKDVLVVSDDFSPGAPLPVADVQVTNSSGWLLSLRFADCVPLLMVHPERRAVAAVHAGWRGTLKGSAGAAIRALGYHFGVEPGGLWVGIGPAIGPCCYEVGNEVAGLFQAAGGDSSVLGSPEALTTNGVKRNGHSPPRLDLWKLNQQAVLAAGVPPEQIECARLCTRCRSDLFFSHRGQGYPAGRFSAAIGLT